MTRISVRPADEGWMMVSPVVANPLFFRSGASAESAAVRLAQGLVDAGKDVEIEFYLRDGSLGRRVSVPAIRHLRPFRGPAVVDA